MIIAIVIVVYVLIAAASVFGLCLATVKTAEHSGLETYIYDFEAPIWCGIFWPVAAPIYAAYIAVRWYTRH